MTFSPPSQGNIALLKRQIWCQCAPIYKNPPCMLQSSKQALKQTISHRRNVGIYFHVEKFKKPMVKSILIEINYPPASVPGGTGANLHQSPGHSVSPFQGRRVLAWLAGALGPHIGRLEKETGLYTGAGLGS